MIFLDNESGNPNSVTFKAQFKSDGSKNTGTLWEFSGIAGKDWKIIKGSLESEEVELEFKKVGIYSFTLNTTYQYSVAGEEEDEEDEKSIEKENILTVTKNLDELTQIYADKDYLKLVNSIKPFR